MRLSQRWCHPVEHQLTVGLPTTLWFVVGAVAFGTLSVSLFPERNLVTPVDVVLGLAVLGAI